MQVHFKGGASTERVAVEYPVGHRRRRQEGIPLLRAKFEAAVRAHFGKEKASAIVGRFSNLAALDALPVGSLSELLAP